MSIAIAIEEGRFARFKAIEWWDQERMEAARILVIGAGALGNEVIKNLALLGVGHVTIVDLDRVERSNLSRSVLFRESDTGQSKAHCAAAAGKAIFPGTQYHAIDGNVLAEVGLGHFRWANVVIGALDNREARVFVNSACARVGRPWIDGGIEVLHGVVRGFAPPATACYECTMSKVDWDLLNQRRSCSLVARRAVANHGVPTTPTTASIIAAMQVQEVVKHLHGQRALLGAGFVFDGAEHSSYRVNYSISPDCPWHEPAPEIVPLPGAGSDTPLQVVWDAAAAQLGEVDAIDFGREVVERVECSCCSRGREIHQPAERITAAELTCLTCGAECAPVFMHSIVADAGRLARTPRQLGLPAWDVVWARRGDLAIGFELAADNPFAPTLPQPPSTSR